MENERSEHSKNDENALCKCPKGKKSCKKPVSLKQLDSQNKFKRMSKEWSSGDKSIPYRQFVKNWFSVNK